jgi:alkylation response protein AidB-like acyl-CoA dehydrogenase
MPAPLTNVSLDVLRSDVSTWLDANWNPAMPKAEWQAKVIDAGWAAPTWMHPAFGRSATSEQGKVIHEEFAKRKAPGSSHDRNNLWANTMIAYGSSELQQQMLRPLLMGDVNMCLLYSEPGAGSDLAGVQTRADRDGDEWIVNGQKVWTSGAKVAEYGMLIARTDWDQPKHRGLSFFWFPMRQPGVEVRPIKQITGEAHFNEVFITNARVSQANMLSSPGEGWRVLQTALAYERLTMGDNARGPRQPGVGEKDESTEAGARSSGATEIDLWAMARTHGVSGDPVVRQGIAHVHSLRMVNRWNGQRAKAQLQQGTSSPILSLGKLAMSQILHEGAKVQTQIVGTEALLVGDTFPDASDANFLSLNAYFTSIGGGTDQIQRNIIGERVLGLPKEPELDRDQPFSQVRKASVAGR